MELEYKLRLASADEREAIARVAGPCVATLEQANHYFAGGPEWERSRLVLRLREQGGRWWLTLKGLGGAAGALHRRPEFERELPAREAAALLDDPPALLRRLQAELAGAGEGERIAGVPDVPPAPLGMLHNTRRVHQLDGGLRLELDETRYPDGSTGHELEAELDGDDAGEAERRLRALLAAAGVPWRPATDTKFARFLAALGRA